jgi:hypothetical protein
MTKNIVNILILKKNFILKSLWGNRIFKISTMRRPCFA